MREEVYGSRTLNDNGPLFGLIIYDLVGAVGVLIVTSFLFRPLGVEFFSIPATALSLFALIPIRMRYRRRIIRDSLGFWLGARALYEVKHASRR